MAIVWLQEPRSTVTQWNSAFAQLAAAGCPPGFVLVGGECQCPSGTAIDNSTTPPTCQPVSASPPSQPAPTSPPSLNITYGKVLDFSDSNFDQQVLTAQGPVVVEFWAPSCGACTLFAPTYEQFAKDNPQIKVGRVNADNSPATASKYGVRGTPTIMVFLNGQKVADHLGTMTAGELQQIAATPAQAPAAAEPPPEQPPPEEPPPAAEAPPPEQPPAPQQVPQQFFPGEQPPQQPPQIIVVTQPPSAPAAPVTPPPGTCYPGLIWDPVSQVCHVPCPVNYVWDPGSQLCQPLPTPPPPTVTPTPAPTTTAAAASNTPLLILGGLGLLAVIALVASRTALEENPCPYCNHT